MIAGKKAKEKKPNGGVERFTLLALLFTSGVTSDTLIRSFPSTLTSVAYVVSLVLMAVATLRALSSRRQTQSESKPGIPAAPAWHAHRAFTDPLFQLPASFCMVVVLIDLTLEVMAEPPESVLGLWFLGGMAAAILGASAAILWRVRSADLSTAADAQGPGERPRQDDEDGGAFEDPWFAIPGLIVPIALAVRPILEEIEEGNPFGPPTFYLAGVLVAGGTAAVLVWRQRRRERQTASEDERLSVGTTGEDG